MTREGAKHDELVAKHTSMRTELQARSDAKTQEVNKFNEELSDATARKAELEAQIKDHQREEARRKANIADLKKRGDTTRRRRDVLLKYIKDAEERMAKAAREDKDQKIRALQEKKDEHARVEVEYTQLRESRESLNKRIEEAVMEARAVNDRANAIRTRRTKLQNDLRDMERAKQDRVAVFGRETSDLLREINSNARRFKRKPIGPIGMHIELRVGHEYAAAVETAIARGMLRGYIVDNYDDERVMKDIFNKLRIKGITLYVTRFSESVYPRLNEPHRDILTVFRAIKVDDPTVANLLIDQKRIETVALAKDRQEAEDIVHNSGDRYVSEAYTQKGGRAFKSRGGAKNFSNANETSQMLGVNVEDRIISTQEELNNLEAQLRTSEAPKRQADQQRQAAESERSALIRKVSNMENRLATLKDDIRDEEDRARASERVLDEDLTEQEENVKKEEAEMRALNDQATQAQDDAAKVMKMLAPLKDRLAEINEANATKDAQFDVIDREISKLTRDITKETSALDELEKLRGSKNQKLGALNAELLTTEQTLQEKTDKALAYCPQRVPAAGKKSPAQLDSTIKTFEDRIRKEQASKKKSVMEVTKQFGDAQKKFKEIELQISALTHYRDKVKQNLAERHRRWLVFRASIARRTRLLFNTHLASKGYAGTIEFDHKARTLDITVQLDKMRPSEESIARDTKTLSGGERSFSTVSLLLALWEAMEMPFRAMDEFDVFMDAVNRRLSMDLLTNAARQHASRQFIFITPHDISTIQSAPDIKVHRMYPPERGQQTLVEML
eukprot:TRINITY_DN6487_c0_g1_i1.p1 TRINITY_DN6487_c0_g1~~TRINITY_DN6487_c0_g1_i1.p1  ORF type:complete len:791 (+),score=201.75 TRINITY_DN6487_c0_g1_i1:2-2374(+)